MRELIGAARRGSASWLPLIGHAIAHYRILMLDSKRDVIGFGWSMADSDEAALLAARAWLGKHPAVEVWKGPRVVAVLTVATHLG